MDVLTSSIRSTVKKANSFNKKVEVFHLNLVFYVTGICPLDQAFWRDGKLLTLANFL